MTWSAGAIAFSFLGGALLGFVYFVGLWLTTRATPTVKRPGVLLVWSFVGRAVLLLGGLYLLTRGDPLGLFASLIGFYLSRQTTTRLISAKGEQHVRS